MQVEAQYTTRLDAALALATDAFRHQERKGSGTPYLLHLLQVLVTVGEHGGDEDQMIAAVLHDYLEDIDGSNAADLQARFGHRVRHLVEALSDTVVRPKPPWKERKLRYLAQLREHSADVKLISAADKLHNAKSIESDHAILGEAIWDRFTATKAETLWYYASVVDALGYQWQHRLLEQLREVVARLQRLA